MRTIYYILLCVLLTLGASKAKHKNNNGQKTSSYSVDLPMPENLDEFIENQETAATTPQGGALIFIQALIEYSKGTELGEEFMTHAIFEDDLVRGDLSRADRYRLARVHEFMARAYVDGTSPDTCYRIPDKDEIRLRFRDQTKYVGSIASGRYKVFVLSGDEELSARPMTLKRNDDGIWKVVEFSSMTLPLKGYETCLE